MRKMKYKLETIPVWDAFDDKGECPFCLLEQKAENEYLSFYLGNSVMVPEIRVQVNEVGFCPGHFSMLYATRTNRHALSLVTHTRFGKAAEKANDLLAGLAEGRRIRGKFGKIGKKEILAAAQKLEAHTSGCLICSRIQETLKRYIFTALYLWKNDEEGFRRRYAASKGVCLPHLARLLEMSTEVLRRKQLEAWLKGTARLQRDNAARLDGELFWYTRKFDSQNDDKPLGNAEKALERGIQKLSGRLLNGP